MTIDSGVELAYRLDAAEQLTGRTRTRLAIPTRMLSCLTSIDLLHTYRKEMPMKRIIFIIVLALATSTVALGQTPDKKADKGTPAGEKVAATSSVEQSIRQLEDERNQALVRGDTAFIERLYADDYASTVGSTVRTKAEVLADLKSGNLKIELSKNDEATVRVYGDTAVVTGRSTGKVLDRGQDTSGQSYFTRVYVKQNGQWRLVAFHSSRVGPQTGQQPQQQQPSTPQKQP